LVWRRADGGIDGFSLDAMAPLPDPFSGVWERWREIERQARER
jgi:hypothetical protein